MSANPYESPETRTDSPERKSKYPFTLFQLLVVIAVLGMLVAALLPNVRGSREAARRMQCGNNLKQIALGLQNYESVYHCLPPAYTVDAAGKPLHSWRTLILPFIEQKSLYDEIDLSKPWDDPANRSAFEALPHMYRCPSGDAGKSQTPYLAIVAAGGCFKPTEPRKLADIVDLHDLTLMVVEVASEDAVHWMSPHNATEAMILNARRAGTSPHPDGAMVACVSGDVFLLHRDLEAAVLRALISIAGNDDDIAQEAD